MILRNSSFWFIWSLNSLSQHEILHTEMEIWDLKLLLTFTIFRWDCWFGFLMLFKRFEMWCDSLKSWVGSVGDEIERNSHSMIKVQCSREKSFELSAICESFWVSPFHPPSSHFSSKVSFILFANLIAHLACSKICWSLSKPRGDWKWGEWRENCEKREGKQMSLDDRWTKKLSNKILWFSTIFILSFLCCFKIFNQKRFFPLELILPHPLVRINELFFPHLKTFFSAGNSKNFTRIPCFKARTSSGWKNWKKCRLDFLPRFRLILV